jgi:hypothetical protein
MMKGIQETPSGRFFNTAGPVECEKHYCLDPLERVDLEEVLRLIRQEKYFVLHSPRQTGKTSCLLALMKHLNRSKRYRCLYVNVEIAQAFRETIDDAVRIILGEIAANARYYLKDDYPERTWRQHFETRGSGGFNELLSQWSAQSEIPLVVLIDEIDSLVGDTLIFILRQLRAGYNKRPDGFPQSVILCGVRDVRDYRIHSAREKAVITGGSAFNIKAKSLRLGDFSEQEVGALLSLHTKETGQPFHSGAKAAIWAWTEGQPWLVNALAYETSFESRENRDRSVPITPEKIEQAKEVLIRRRDVHLDQLADKLTEERVRRVIEPILMGHDVPEYISPDDVEYVRDLGLIKHDGNIRIANRIYQEVIPRELTYSTQLTISEEPKWYVRRDTKQLDMDRLMTAFQDFFRTHSEHWVERFHYKEAGPQLLLQAFLQRIVNSGGRVEREYGLGRKRTDILVIWHYPGGVQKVVVELKLRKDGLDRLITEGARQTADYMDRCGADQGHLVVFDRDKEKSWEEKIFCRETCYNGQKIQVWGM